MESKLRSISAAKRVLVASDFDGTLAPLVRDPSTANALTESVDALHALHATGRVELAIVSGRGLDELERFCRSFPPCWKIGDHGRSFRSADGDHLPEPTASSVPPELDEIEIQARAIAARWPGAAVERKTFGVCLHTRNVEGPCRIQAVEEAERWIARWDESHLESMRGREVFEIQSRGGGKLAALDLLAQRLRPGFAVFAGDDTTDLEAIEAFSASPDRIGVWIDSPERPPPRHPPDLRVDGPRGWASWLGSLATRLKETA